MDTNQLPKSHIIEGTNWTSQHASTDTDTDPMYASMSVVAAMFTEITKISVIKAADDIGKGRMDMCKVKIALAHFFAAILAD